MGCSSLYEEEGLAAARAFLDRVGRRDNLRFEALVHAAVHAVPRTRKADGSFFPARGDSAGGSPADALRPSIRLPTRHHPRSNSPLETA